MARVLSICYGTLFDRNKHSLSTDEFAELFTGAPLIGHVPVIMRLERSSNTETTKKLWIEKSDWQVGLLSLRAKKTQKFQVEIKRWKPKKLKAAKAAVFRSSLNNSVTEWLENYLSSLWHKKGREFWTSFKTLLNTINEEVGLIRSKERRLLYAPDEISK